MRVANARQPCNDPIIASIRYIFGRSFFLFFFHVQAERRLPDLRGETLLFAAAVRRLIAKSS